MSGRSRRLVTRWLFSFPSESLELAAVGRMAFFTALEFVCAAGAVLSIAPTEALMSE